MHAVITFFLVLYVLEGVGMMAAAVPFILGRVKPNRWSGFRVSQTLNDERTWYRINAQFGRWLLGVGALFALAAVIFYFVPEVNTSIPAYTLLCTFVLLAGLTTAIVVCFGAMAE